MVCQHTAGAVFLKITLGLVQYNHKTISFISSLSFRNITASVRQTG